MGNGMIRVMEIVFLLLKLLLHDEELLTFTDRQGVGGRAHDELNKAGNEKHYGKKLDFFQVHAAIS